MIAVVNARSWSLICGRKHTSGSFHPSRWKTGNGETVKVLELFLSNFCRSLCEARSLCEDTAIFVECRRNDDKSASDVAVQVTNLK